MHILSIILFQILCVAYVYANDISNIDGVLEESKTLIEQQNYKQAISVLEQSVLKWPDNSDLWYFLAISKTLMAGKDSEGRVIHSKGSYESLDHLSRAMKIDNKNIEYKILFSQLADDFYMYSKSVPVYEDIFTKKEIRIHEKLRYLVINYAIALQKLGRADNAQEEYEKSLIATNHDDRIFWAYLGMLSGTKKYDQMLNEYTKFEKKKGYVDWVLYKLCNEYFASEEYTRAETCYRNILNKKEKTDERILRNIDFEMKEISAKK
jgi:tetratricopeptide (TPR) repeat protein